MRLVIVVIGAAFVSVVLAPSAFAADAMPAGEENALVRKHCAVCHNDRSKNGGLTLEHFDASEVAPSLAAMMLSKVTQGLPLDAVARASSDPVAETALSQRVMGGAIMAAGVAPPEVPRIVAFALALAAQAKGANAWHVSQSTDAATKAQITTVSTLREALRTEGTAESYRLLLTCDQTSRTGHMQLAWSPLPRVGTFSVTSDGAARGPYRVEGKEQMGNNVGSSSGLAAYEFTNAWLPARSLAIRNLFPTESVEFTFSALPPAARTSLAACFDRK